MDEHQSSGKKRGRKRKQQEDSAKLKIGSIEERITEDDNPRKLCTICKKDFPSGKALGGHMRVHRQDSSSASSQRRFINADGFAPVCSECGRSFHSWKSLYGHMRCHSTRSSKGDDDLVRAIPRWPVTGKRGRGGGPFPAPELEDMEAARNLMWLARGPRLWAREGYRCFLVLDDRKGPKIDVNVTINGVVNEKKRGRKKKVKLEIGEDPNEGDRVGYPDGETGRVGYQCVTCKKEFSTHQALGGHRSKHYRERSGGSGSCYWNPGHENGSPGACYGSGVYQWGGPTGEDEVAAPVMPWEAGGIGLVVDVDQVQV